MDVTQIVVLTVVDRMLMRLILTIVYTIVVSRRVKDAFPAADTHISGGARSSLGQRRWSSCG